MIKQLPSESRPRYLARVLSEYMEAHGHETIDYDDITGIYDGATLAEDIENEINIMEAEMENKKGRD